MSFSVEWSKAAAKQLLKIPKKQRLIILSWIQDYLDEFEHYCLWPCAKALQGSESGWRSRVASTVSWEGSRVGKPSSRS